MTILDNGWTFADHACRRCLGRIIRQGAAFRCHDCGAEGRDRPESICGCGIAASATLKGTFKCARNPRRAEGFQAEIVVVFGGNLDVAA